MRMTRLVMPSRKTEIGPIKLFKIPETLYYPDRGSKTLIDFTFAFPLEGSRSGNIDNRRLTAAAANV
jgi:hypothetical protein